jgi:hypothetical protein
MKGRIRVLGAASLVFSLSWLAGHISAQSPSPWKQTAYLKASNARAGDHFGCGGALDGHAGNSVSLSSDGSTMAVGAPHESSGAKGINGNQSDTSMYDAGAVYVFTRSGGGWAQQAYVKASHPSMSAEFGHVVALSTDGNTMAVSAYFESSKATGINGDETDHSIPTSKPATPVKPASATSSARGISSASRSR